MSRNSKKKFRLSFKPKLSIRFSLKNLKVFFEILFLYFHVFEFHKNPGFILPEEWIDFIYSYVFKFHFELM